MAQVLSPKEVQDKYVRAMGEELGQLYYELSNELASLHIKWQQYCELFGKNPERIDLLNEVAPLFFWYLQHTLFDDIQLQLARLTDPPQTGHGKNRNLNLTMQRLPQLIPDPQLTCKVEKMLGKVKRACDFARQWRNKWIAHRDLAAKRNPRLLRKRTRRKVKDALAAMGDLMNSIAQHYHLEDNYYEETIGAIGGAEALCKALEVYRDLLSVIDQDISLEVQLSKLGIKI